MFLSDATADAAMSCTAARQTSRGGFFVNQGRERQTINYHPVETDIEHTD